MDDFVKVARAADLDDTKPVTVTVGAYSVLIAKLEDGIFATENQCSHAQSELAGGRFRRGRISCPLHGVIFDFRSGQVMGGTLTAMGLQTFDTRLQDGDVWVRSTPNERLRGIMKR